MNNKNIIIIALFSFVLSLALMVPLKLVYPRLNIVLPASLTMESLSGNVWQGQASVRYQSIPFVIDWQFMPSSLFSLQPSFHVLASQADGSELTMMLQPGVTQTSAKQLNMTLKPELLSKIGQIPVMAKFPYTNGSLSVSDMALTVNNNGAFPVMVSGYVTWSGGMVHSDVMFLTAQNVVPNLQGRLYFDEASNDIQIDVQNEQDGEIVLATLNQPTRDDVANGAGDIKFDYQVSRKIVEYLNPDLLNMVPNTMQGSIMLGKLEMAGE